MKQSSRIYVAGHFGLIESAIVRFLAQRGFENVIAITHEHLELVDAASVHRFFQTRNQNSSHSPPEGWGNHREPDGAPRKLLDSSRLLAFGWQPEIGLAEGLKSTYAWYLDKVALFGAQE
jgi:nucleoside-diphosphate-sugar epimerase